ncbi:uncharacterized protein DNG_07278 [Cephalotrichum gorgonifer]|uniref:Inosine/uridine-preferring nucleoside hydrolase domain-containing protein n=1 Tax=Cephalotrichum gorgonifer TaxID=2041049 RepID=A0AAE8N361_9PEZI|nr:uncharacterized protein DNG_07278 [Cephalotrichum gorgonifer]
MDQKIATIKARAQEIPGVISQPELMLLERLVILRRSLPTNYLPKKILIFTDICRDPDDQNAILALVMLEKLGFVQMVGVVTTSPPTRHRARFAKALLEEHGLPWIPVAAGIDYKADVGQKGQFDCIGELDFDIATCDGPDLAGNILRGARDRKDVTLLCISPMFDIAETFRRYPDSYQGIAMLVLQSGASLSSDGRLKRQVGTHGEPVPNYNADGDDEVVLQDSTDLVFRYLHRYGAIDCIFLSKEAAATAQVPGMAHYEQLRRINARIHTTYNTTKALYEQQKESLVELFADVVEDQRAPYGRVTSGAIRFRAQLGKLKISLETFERKGPFHEATLEGGLQGWMHTHKASMDTTAFSKHLWEPTIEGDCDLDGRDKSVISRYVADGHLEATFLPLLAHHNDHDLPSRILGLALLPTDKPDEYSRIGRAAINLIAYQYTDSTLPYQELTLI